MALDPRLALAFGTYRTRLWRVVAALHPAPECRAVGFLDEHLHPLGRQFGGDRAVYRDDRGEVGAARAQRVQRVGIGEMGNQHRGDVAADLFGQRFSLGDGRVNWPGGARHCRQPSAAVAGRGGRGASPVRVGAWVMRLSG